MSPLKPNPKPKNISTRWQCRPDRGPGAVEPFRKARRSRHDHLPLTVAQQDLAARFLPLARALAKPLKEIFTQWKDEFESAACLALVEAARSFDPARNIQFATFARFRIRGALVDVGRRMGLSGWENDPEEAPGIVTLTPYNEERGRMILAAIPPAVGSEFEDIDAVEHLLKKLPRKHALVCRMQYLYGKTQSEIAKSLGCSQAEVTRLHQKSLELLSDPYDVSGKYNGNQWRRKRRQGTSTESVGVQEGAIEAGATAGASTGPEDQGAWA